MVPAAFGLLAALPTPVSGKLNRAKLPVIESHDRESGIDAVRPPRSRLEAPGREALSPTSCSAAGRVGRG